MIKINDKKKGGEIMKIIMEIMKTAFAGAIFLLILYWVMFLFIIL